ncbi:chlamydia polymorphic membrane middle domain protein, partial [Chlamydia psittaci 02DC18]|jgi:hypothetical protein
LSI